MEIHLDFEDGDLILSETSKDEGNEDRYGQNTAYWKMRINKFDIKKFIAGILELGFNFKYEQYINERFSILDITQMCDKKNIEYKRDLNTFDD